MLRLSRKAMKAALWLAVLIVMGYKPCAGASEIKCWQYGQVEVAMQAKASYKNYYTDVTLTATFTGPTQAVKVNGFWDGRNVFRVRMTPTEPGVWKWSVSSKDSKLNGARGSFVCKPSKSRDTFG